MSKHLRILRSAAIALILAAPAVAEEEVSAENVIAVVNGEEITLGHLIMVRSTLPAQYDQVEDALLFDAVLNQAIQQTLLAQTYTKDLPLRVQVALENQRRQLVAGEVIQDALEGVVTEDALSAAYAEKYADFAGALEYNASHILVESEEEAATIRQDILGGADFAEMAKAKSTGPSGASGGVLGWFGKGEMVPQFEDAVASMTIGDVSEPVQTEFGWHLIILNDTRVQSAPALAEVSQELTAVIQENAIDAHIAGLTEKADIDSTVAQTLDPAIIKNIDLLSPVSEGN
nr:peptidylprolyl isomerase [uncultured Shimia sp.]